MKISFQDLADILYEFSNLRTEPLYNESQIQKFCQTHRYHSLQSELQPPRLGSLLSQLRPDELLLLTDCLRIRMCFALTDDGPVVIGPFCTEIYDVRQWEDLDIPTELRSAPTENLLTYRAQYPVLDRKTALHSAASFLKLLCGEDRQWQLRESDHSRDLVRPDETQIFQQQTELLEERYRLEQEMYEALRQGRGRETVRLNHLLEQRVAHLKGTGNTLYYSFVGASMVRNSARLVAYNCGVPAVILNDISVASSARLEEATTIEETFAAMDRMLLDFAAAIRRQAENKYSKLIYSLLYAIERNYREDLTVSGLAEELGVSTDTLVRRCRKELGTTPSAYIRRVRMNKAAQLLQESPASIQEISEAVGILDANYFVKLFKQAYGETPTAYRAARAL